MQKKGKRAVPDPITTTLITAGVKFAVDLGKSLFGDKITETTTFIEQSMVQSTTRALTGTRPISLNIVNQIFLLVHLAGHLFWSLDYF